MDCQLNSLFEFLLGLNSISNSLSELLEGWWVNEEEVTLETRLVDVDGASGVNFNDRDPSSIIYSLEFFLASTVEVSADLAVFNEVFVVYFLHKKQGLLAKEPSELPRKIKWETVSAHLQKQPSIVRYLPSRTLLWR